MQVQVRSDLYFQYFQCLLNTKLNFQSILCNLHIGCGFVWSSNSRFCLQLSVTIHEALVVLNVSTAIFFVIGTDHELKVIVVSIRHRDV